MERWTDMEGRTLAFASSVVVVVACSPVPRASAPAPPPPPPQPVVRVVAPPAPPPELPPDPEPLEPLAVEAHLGSSIIARAGPADRWVAMPFEAPDGEALLAIVAADGSPRVPRFARVAHDTVTLAPELSAGLPPLAGDGATFLAAGSFDAELWFASGSPCEVRAFRGGAWAVQAPARPVAGPCRRLSAWTPGAAVAALDDMGSSLAIFGAAPGALTPAPPRVVTPDCKQRVAWILGLRAFPSGDVVSVASACDSPDIVVESWPAGAATSQVSLTGVYNEGPIDAKIPSAREIVIDAAGDVSRPDGDVRVVMRPRGGRFAVASRTPAQKNADELWMVVPRSMLALADEEAPDDFHFERYWLAPDREVFVAGTLMRAGRPVQSVLVRTRPVAVPLVVPPP